MVLAVGAAVVSVAWQHQQAQQQQTTGQSKASGGKTAKTTAAQKNPASAKQQTTDETPTLAPSSSTSNDRPQPTLTPAAEMVRGFPGTLQRELVDDGKTPFATLHVVNDAGTEPIEVYWNGKLITMAAAGWRAKVETWIGHEFIVGNESVTVDGTFDAVVFGESNGDGTKKPPRRTTLSSLPPPRKPRNPPPVPLESQAKAIKVRNLSNRRMHSFWVPDGPGAERVYQGVIEPNSESTTNSYLTHRFQYTDLKDKKKVLFDFRVNETHDIYAHVDPKTADPRLLRMHLEEIELAKDYKQRTGRSWLSFYPHAPVRSFLWPADEIGQTHRVFTKHLPGGGEGYMTLEVISVKPRAFLIRNAITEEEAAEIIRRAKGGMAPSSVSAHDDKGNLVMSDTRTSVNSWVERAYDEPKINEVYARAADVLRVNDTVFHHRYPDGVSESMRVVWYRHAAKYAPHHDWGVHDSPHTRLMTLLFYLNTPPKGQGLTAFPKAEVGKRDGLRVHPGKGHAVLFYSQTPDGNVDDLSLHEAEPVTKGEKWLANLWVHDAVYWRTEKDMM